MGTELASVESLKYGKKASVCLKQMRHMELAGQVKGRLKEKHKPAERHYCRSGKSLGIRVLLQSLGEVMPI